VATASQANQDRRERLRKLALETIDLNKDPYFMKNHLGQYECRLCLTLHTNEGSYLAHTQGRKHQDNLGRRAAREAKDGLLPTPTQKKVGPVKRVIKIGRPGYRAMKIREPSNGQLGLLFQIEYPEIAEGVIPRYRFMAAFEQKIETPNKDYQYLLFAAEPYETISFKIQSREIDRTEGKFLTHWDIDSKVYTLQFFFRTDAQGLPPRPLPK